MREFTCFRCKETFTVTASESVAMEEFKQNFKGHNDPATEASLCDDCYDIFWEWAKVNAPELKRVV